MINSYWEYAGTQYKSKIKAIEASGGDISSISFFAFSDSFYSYSWDIEPTESWEELLLQRALLLREKYKYLKLWFSGGADSTTVLNTFLRNNIYIDEIVVYRFAINDNFLNKSNHEIDNYTTPFLKNLNNILINTKITYDTAQAAADALAYFQDQSFHVSFEHREDINWYHVENFGLKRSPKNSPQKSKFL
jgi:hypothetical protein